MDTATMFVSDHSQCWGRGGEKSLLSVAKLPVPVQQSQDLGKRTRAISHD